MAIRRTNGPLSWVATTPTMNAVGILTKKWDLVVGNTANDVPWGKYWDWGPTSSGATTEIPVVTPLSTADVLNARYLAAYNQWNASLADAYKALNQENTSYNRVANQIADYYNALAQDVARREQWLAEAKYDVANRLFQDMASQRDYVYGLYGPEWTFTREVNTYYDDLGDYLASEAWREMAYADALWVQSWASIWMMRAQRNQAYNEAFQRSLQVMQQELEAKQNIQQNLINFMTTLRQEYWDTANTYIISQYQRANDLLNTISESIASTSANIATARLSAWWGGGWQPQPERWWDKLSTKEKLDLLRKNGYNIWNWIDTTNRWDLLISNWDDILTISSQALKNAWFNGLDYVRSYLSWWLVQ